MPLRIALIALVLAACSSSPSTRPVSVPDPMETPPTTNDPGAPQDTTPVPPAPPPGEGTTAETPPPATPPGDLTRPDGAACLISSECASGVCEGEGCDTPGKCMPRSRACTRDLRTYCGCDGKVFQASGSCPGQRYANKGQCKGS